MTTTLDSLRQITQAFDRLCDGHLVKLITKTNLLVTLRYLVLIPYGTMFGESAVVVLEGRVPACAF
jgi:hypothetical protein